MYMADSFIGETFSTPKGGTLTVVGREGSSGKFILTCDLCSADEGLWPLGSIRATKGHLNKGKCPCGCTRHTWTKEQWTTRVIRQCSAKNYKFHGYLSWRGYKTLLKLECLSDGNFWETTCMDSFLRGVGCPECYAMTDEEHIKDFLEAGNFLEGTIFSRNVERSSLGGAKYWDMYCPYCSNDEYVLNGVCTGVFTIQQGHLKGGRHACRCSKKYYWSKEQREYQILKRLENLGGTFDGWFLAECYADNRSSFTWFCREGHYCKTSVSSFIDYNRGCYTCAKLASSYNGYYVNRVEELDYLYVMDFKYAFKVGRSFCVDSRQKDLKWLAGLNTLPDVVSKYRAKHQTIFDIEQTIHEELRKCGYQYDVDWTTECFYYDCKDHLYSLLTNYVKTGLLIECK